jgi:hypothetical protein
MEAPLKPRSLSMLKMKCAKDLLGLYSISNGGCFVCRGGLSMADMLFQPPSKKLKQTGHNALSLAE